MTPTEGRCDERFAGVREALDERLRSGEELGAALAVDLDGERVVDLWGGFRDAARTAPWAADTIVDVWSTTKTVTALAALVLADRGELDVDAPVARYWPEFAAAGKDRVLVRHVLGHTSGVAGWDRPVTVEDLYDAPAAAARLAAQAPWWEPGSAAGYHAVSQGHLVGELVRRITGRSLTRFVDEELAQPLAADVRIGAREEDRERIAEVVPPPPPPRRSERLPRDSPIVRTFTGPVLDAAAANTEAWRRAELGAVNGHGSARGVARLLSVIACGGEVDGRRLLRAETIDLIFREQAHGVDLVLDVPVRWGIGWALPEPALLPYVPDGRVCFWGGWGGSLVVTDLERRLTIAYVMNRMAPGILGSPRSEAYVRAVYASLGVGVS